MICIVSAQTLVYSYLEPNWAFGEMGSLWGEIMSFLLYQQRLISYAFVLDFFPPDSLAFTFSIFCLSNLVWHHPFLKQNSTHWFPGVSECELYFHFSNIDSTTATWLKEHHCCTSFLFLLQTCLSKLFRKLLKTVWAWKMLENQFYFLYIQKLLNLHTCALFVFVILMIS